MNREMAVFFMLTVLLGTLLFAGLQLEPQPLRIPQARSTDLAPEDVSPPTSHGPTAVLKERKNPFAPPIEVKPISQPKPPKPTDVQAPPPPPPPPVTNVVKPAPKQINNWSPAEIPVGFAGIFALPGQPAEAHLLAKDGSTMVVHVGDEIKSLGVKVVEISGNDVTVQVGDRRASLRDLIQKSAANPPAGGTNVPSGPAPANMNDLIKKLLGGAGGGLDLQQLQNLTPEQQQQLMQDPMVRKLVEEHLKSNGVTLPGATDTRRPGGNGGGENRGGRGRGNRGDGTETPPREGTVK